MPYLLAIDPGGTTGLAVRYPNGKVQTCTCNTQEELWSWFLLEEMGQLPDHVIMEEWVYFDNIVKPAGLYTASLVNGVVAICWLLDIPLALRTPSSRKNKIPTAKSMCHQIKGPGNYVIHEWDALAHLLTWEEEHARGIKFPTQRRTTTTDPSESSVAKPWVGSRRAPPRRGR